jgi:hypothetical protein
LYSLYELTSERVIAEDGEAYFTVMINPEMGTNTVAVLSVEDYIMGDSDVDAAAVERLMSAIEEGGKLLSVNSDSMKISLHEATGLLFVTGNVEEIRLVTQIVEQLTGNRSSGRAGGLRGGGTFGSGGGGGAGAGGGAR